MKTKYRVVEEEFKYFPQVKYWWFPFYIELYHYGFSFIEDAHTCIVLHKRGKTVIYEST